MWHRVGIDLVGPLPLTPRGNRYIITLTDYFSKWPEAASLQDKTAVGVAEFLMSIFFRHGWPQIVQSDQGREFVNDVTKSLFQLTGVEHRISSAYHPQTNGLDERMNQTLVRTLIKLTQDQQENWDLHLEGVLYSYRISRQDSSKFSPYFLMYNRHPRKAIDHELANSSIDPASLIDDEDRKDTLVKQLIELREHNKAKATENILKAQARQKKYYDVKHSNYVSYLLLYNISLCIIVYYQFVLPLPFT